MVRLPIAYFLAKPQGSRDTFEVNEPEFLFMPGDEVTLLSPITAKGTLVRLPHELTVHLQDLSATVELTCSRCLRHFSHTITIPSTERQFIIDTPEEEIGEDEEVFYVNMKTNEVDITDMIREEILLHFPAFPVCSESCKGLCEQCGANLNEGPCACGLHPSAALRQAQGDIDNKTHP